MAHEQQYKYFAFISYNQHDLKWGKRLQRKLEGYRMPATLCREHGLDRNPLKPLFFAPTDIQPGGLSAELQERLKASKNLIVICSPHSARSKWVGDEIRFFHSLGRADNIFFFIVDGTPHSGDPETECFNSAIEELGMPEVLGVNIHEKIYRSPWLNKERAYIQLITKLLGIEFDSLWQRHRRLLIAQLTSWAVGIVAVLAMLIGAWIMNSPVDVNVMLNETTAHNPHLPPLQNAVVTLSLDNETKSDTVMDIKEGALFKNIPHKYLNKAVRITFTRIGTEFHDYNSVDTTLILKKETIINIARNDSIYGNVFFKFWNGATEATLPNHLVKVNGQQIMSDANGEVSLFIRLPEQRPAYHISVDGVNLEHDTLYMPCIQGNTIRFQ